MLKLTLLFFSFQELQTSLDALEEEYSTTSALAQTVQCPDEQSQAIDAVSKHRAKISQLSQAIQVLIHKEFYDYYGYGILDCGHEHNVMRRGLIN